MRFSLVKSSPIIGALVILTVTPLAAAAQSSPSWTAAPGAAADASDYLGFIDTPTNGATVSSGGAVQINGWFVDATAQGWSGADQVQVFEGLMGDGGTMLAQGSVGESRPDVGAALGNPFDTDSGFSVSVPASALQMGGQTLGVYLHTPDKGWFYQSLNINLSPSGASPSTSAVAGGAPQVSVSNPSEGENVLTRSNYTINGAAAEPGSGPSDIDRIDVYIDGERATGTLLGETTPASDGSWSVTFTPTHFASTHSNIYVYAHSRSTGQETEIVRGFNIVDK